MTADPAGDGQEPVPNIADGSSGGAPIHEPHGLSFSQTIECAYQYYTTQKETSGITSHGEPLRKIVVDLTGTIDRVELIGEQFSDLPVSGEKAINLTMD